MIVLNDKQLLLTGLEPYMQKKCFCCDVNLAITRVTNIYSLGKSSFPCWFRTEDMRVTGFHNFLE